MNKKTSVDQQLISELLEEEQISKNDPQPKEEKREGIKSEEPKKVISFAETFGNKKAPLAESAILSGLNENGISKDFISQTMHWVEQNPLESILGAIVIGGIGYKLYQHFTKKPEASSEGSKKDSLTRVRRKRMQERRRSFMEKAKDLFYSENEQGEQKMDLGKTVTAVTVAATGALAGAIASKETLPLTFLGAATVGIAGFALDNPLVSLGAFGIAAGALVSELVRKTIKGSSNPPESASHDSTTVSQKEMLEGFKKAEEVILQEKALQEILDELNAEQEALRERRKWETTGKMDYSEFDRMLKALEEETLPELA